MSSAVLNMPLPSGVATPGRQEPGRWIQVVTHLDSKYGGLSSAVPALGRALADSEHMDIVLAAFCAPGEDVRPAGLESDQLSFWPASRKAWMTDLLRGQTMHKELARRLHGASGLHLHGLWEQSTAVAAQAARQTGVPYVLSAHGMLEPWALANKRAKKLLYAGLVERKNVGGAACLHALTQAEAEQYFAFGARCPVAVIPNGVDVPEHAEATAFLARYPALQGKRIVLFLARLHPKKGLNLLLESWVALASRFPDAHLVIAGPDSEGTQARLTAFVIERGLEASVSFVGMLRGDDKWSALAAAEAMVLPSYSEGLSVSILEAMGLGLPVVITTGCNLPEVEEFKAGWQIEPVRDRLTAALAELLSNAPDENRAIGARGAALVKARFTWPKVAAQMAEVYRWVAGGPKPETVKMIFPERA